MKVAIPYDGHENNRNEFGLLYTWDAAKEACPRRWHLPTDSEWTMLVDQFGGMDKAGEALKSIKGWKEEGNGTNSGGFDAVAGGHRQPDGSYLTKGILRGDIRAKLRSCWAMSVRIVKLLRFSP